MEFYRSRCNLKFVCRASKNGTSLLLQAPRQEAEGPALVVFLEHALIYLGAKVIDVAANGDGILVEFGDLLVDILRVL